VQDLRVRVQSWVNKSNGRLPCKQPLLVNPGEDGRESRRSRGCAANKRRRAFVEDDDIVADCREVRISTPEPVVDAAIRAKAVVAHTGVVGIWWVTGRKVRGHGALLIARDWVNIREPTTGREASDSDFRICIDIRSWGEECGAKSGEIRASRWKIG